MFSYRIIIDTGLHKITESLLDWVIPYKPPILCYNYIFLDNQFSLFERSYSNFFITRILLIYSKLKYLPTYLPYVECLNLAIFILVKGIVMKSFDSFKISRLTKYSYYNLCPDWLVIIFCVSIRVYRWLFPINIDPLYIWVMFHTLAQNQFLKNSMKRSSSTIALEIIIDNREMRIDLLHSDTVNRYYGFVFECEIESGQ